MTSLTISQNPVYFFSTVSTRTFELTSSSALVNTLTVNSVTNLPQGVTATATVTSGTTVEMTLSGISSYQTDFTYNFTITDSDSPPTTTESINVSFSTVKLVPNPSPVSIIRGYKYDGYVVFTTNVPSAVGVSNITITEATPPPEPLASVIVNRGTSVALVAFSGETNNITKSVTNMVVKANVTVSGLASDVAQVLETTVPVQIVEPPFATDILIRNLSILFIVFITVVLVIVLMWYMFMIKH